MRRYNGAYGIFTLRYRVFCCYMATVETPNALSIDSQLKMVWERMVKQGKKVRMRHLPAHPFRGGTGDLSGMRREVYAGFFQMAMGMELQAQGLMRPFLTAKMASPTRFLICNFSKRWSR